jgi:hypothetical protein
MADLGSIGEQASPYRQSEVAEPALGASGPQLSPKYRMGAVSDPALQYAGGFRSRKYLGEPLDAHPWEVLFVGECVSLTIRGRVLRVKAIAGGSIFDRPIPRFRIQPGCNHTLFDAGCGLAKADWRFTAKVGDPGSPGYPFEFLLTDLVREAGEVPVWFENWFAGGWIEFGSGATWCRRPILRSTTVTGGALNVTLSRDPDTFPEADDDVILYPGCDGRDVTYKAHDAGDNPEGKFGNWLNFGGHPFVPKANPSLVKVSQAVAGGKKG